MAELQVKNLLKYYDGRTIFSDVSFTVNKKDKVGIIGPNGSGKTTLLKCILGQEEYDSGSIFINPSAKIGVVEQLQYYYDDHTLIEYVLLEFEDVLLAQKKMKILENKMSETADQAIFDEYAIVRDKFEKANGYALDSKVKGVLYGLGFSEQDIDRKISSLSGGEKTKLSLAKILVREPDFLFLDEPTNHLDVHAVEWLEQYLKRYPGTVLMISHDRYFLNEIVNKICELNHQELIYYNGNYDDYLRIKEHREKTQERAYLKQEKYIEETQAYINRYRAGRKAKQAQGREKQLNRLVKINKVATDQTLKLKTFNYSPPSEHVLTANNLSKTVHHNLLFHNVSFQIMQGDKIGLMGPNGSGKSTLFKILLEQVEADDGEVRWGHNIKLGYYEQEQKNLDDEATVLNTILYGSRLTLSASYSVLARMLFFQEDMDKKVKNLSGGEKARLSLLKILINEPNVLLLDEPTNHVDIQSRDIIEQFLIDYPGTIFIISHDRFFIDQLVNKILFIEDGSLHEYYGNYTYYRLKKEEEEARKSNITSNNSVKDTNISKKKRTRISKSKQRQLVKEYETEIETTEKRMAELYQEIQQTSNDDIDTFTKAGNELNELESKLELLIDNWEEAMEILEAIE